MNFTPFGTTFSGGLPSGGAVTQFTTAKFAHNVSSSGGQVVGLLSSDEAGVTYLRPVDTNGFVNLSQQGNGNSTEGSPQIITLPISVPGSKPGELPQQQTLQIQVVNPGGAGGGNGGEKYALPIFQQGGTTVLTVAYSNPNQDPSSDQPIQLQLQSAEDAQVSQSNNNNSSSSTTTTTTAGTTTGTIHTNEMVLPDVKSISDENNDGASQAYPVAVVTHLPSELMLRSDDGGSKEPKKEEKKDSGTGTDGDGESATGEAGSASWNAMSSSGAVADYLTRLSQSNSLPLSLHHYLKFSPETIKREAQIESSPLAPAEHSDQTQEESSEMDHSTSNAQQLSDDTPKGPKKKKKYKKKAPKPRKPRPGQVHIAFALDGTTLFCCPECNMAYPEKELLEQHLVAHKIERRFICDICGAGLKRKEHLERHKLGHNPERPYICSVCCKGFKRKEHLNLHFVIHSGEKSEVCPECGKGFHRKDHLRKHARSHLAKRVKEETIVVGEDGQPLSDQPLLISQHQQH